ncbi:histone acetyltransferase (RNA polymerase elongator complex component) [Desulfobaculum xiamenense]|uniref:Histone acetyltransferase (RNA polymerase elongator complex component) n=1 Tax=Desulfobaculum xiamenense TaxID=995050 RepID=A0A846QNP9_9BACT|nr:radical SAM protein [Desulfobaculum xiamenense]NJB68092.1 histone acetyltransferase (RNA polymerase elongator complex component) [Desulfobaculum xiamenense]
MNVTQRPVTAPVTFRHPAPQAPRTRIWPAFIPFAGCPFRCVYCAQNEITGQRTEQFETVYDNLARGLNNALKKSTNSLELAFYGGTFTALPEEWIARFLALARTFRDRGLITRVRCSTRPDAVTPELLARLRSMGLDMVELGIQSFDDTALAATGRGYSGDTARRACDNVLASGLSLGVQLMPGLPGHTADAFAADIRTACALAPEAARLYPCVVLAHTPLAARWKRGDYTPWTLDRTIDALAPALLDLWAANIHIIRIGLAPEQDMQDAILDGPWHPAMGQLARSRALFLHISRRIAELNHAPTHLVCPRRFQSDLLGHANSMRDAYAHIGLPADAITFEDTNTFTLR